jgi:hypothetical protein
MLFRLYDRPLHPELFEVLESRTVTEEGYTLSVRLTRTGHALGWARGKVYLEEVTATSEMLLPEAGRRLTHDFNSTRNGRCDLRGGVRYQISSQLEVLPEEQFRHFHEELVLDGARKGLLFLGGTGNRLGPSPLGVVILQRLAAGLSAAAFHTFPEERAVIKTQSLIEWKT